MINQDFWVRVANAWTKKEEVAIPEVGVGPDMPEDFLKADSKEFASLDDFLKDIIANDPDIEEIDVTDFFS